MNGSYQFGKKDLRFLFNDDIDTEEETIKKGFENKHHGKLEDFQMKLPEHLRGKRPRDMNKEEKKEYNNFRAKLSRGNATEEKLQARREKDKIAQAEKEANETQEETLKRKERERIGQSKKRKNETTEKLKIRKEKDKIASAEKKVSLTQQEKLERKEREKVAQSKKRKNETAEKSQMRKDMDKNNGLYLRIFSLQAELSTTKMLGHLTKATS